MAAFEDILYLTFATCMAAYISQSTYIFTLAHGIDNKQSHHTRKYLHVNEFLSKEEAFSLLHPRRKRQAAGVDCSERDREPANCANEHSCECHRVACTNEVAREQQCAHRHCAEGYVCYLQIACPAHYVTACDIDHCESTPCQNRGTCVNGGGGYGCQCDVRWYGNSCELDICDPANQTGADIVFVIDSSLSQGQLMFDKQIQYIKDFVGNFSIGHNETRVALVTFSFSVTIHSYLNTHISEASLISELDQLSHTSGSSYTGTALRVVREEVFTAENGMRPDANQYVVVLTDGLSSNKTDTLIEAANLIASGFEVLTVGIGAQIYHTELLGIASDRTKIFPSSNTDGLFSIFQRQSPQCPDCFRRTSDLIILFDVSTDLSPSQIYPAIDALRVLVEVIPVGPDNVHVSYIEFATEVYEQFDFTENLTKDETITLILSKLKQTIGPANVSKALDHVTNTGFTADKGTRADARKFVVLFTQGNFDNFEEVKSSAESLKSSNITLATVGVGPDVNMTSLLDIASDSLFTYAISDTFNIGEEVLQSMTGSLEFDVCDIF